MLCPSDFSAVLPYVVFRLKLGNSGPRVDGLGKALRGFFKKTIHRALGTHTNGVKLIVVQLAKLGGTQKRQAQNLTAQSSDRIADNELDFTTVK